jgi:hypothetical protein
VHPTIRDFAAQYSESRTPTLEEKANLIAAVARVASAGRRSRVAGNDPPPGVYVERFSQSRSPEVLLRGSGSGFARGTPSLSAGQSPTAAAPCTRTDPQGPWHLPLPADRNRTESRRRHTHGAAVHHSRIDPGGRLKFVTRREESTN